MKRATTRFLNGLAVSILLFASTAAAPGLALTAHAAPQQGFSVFMPVISDDPTPPPLTPEQITYQNLQGEVNGQLVIYFKDMAGYRSEYTSFMYSQQNLGRDTTELQNVLSNFDSYVSQGQTAQTAAAAAVGGNPGLDASGNVVDSGLYNSSVQSALNNDWTARNFLNLATYQLHGGLLQYEYTWGTNVGIPDIPKWHLTPYVLPSP